MQLFGHWPCQFISYLAATENYDLAVTGNAMRFVEYNTPRPSINNDPLAGMVIPALRADRYSL